MALESVPGSVSTPGNLRITFVPSGSNPLSVSVLTGGTAKDLTYSLTPSGFNRGIAQDTIDDERLTLAQKLQKPGIVTETLELQYVYGSGADVNYIALVEGTAGFITARYAIPDATAWTIAQKADVLACQFGHQRKDAPADNGVFTVTQLVFLTAVTVTDGVIVA